MGTKRSIIWKLSKEYLEKVVANSSSIAEILAVVDLKNIGGNYLTIKNRLDFEQIDYSHISLGIGATKGKKFNPRESVSSDKLFIENSTYGRSTIRRRILKSNLLPYKCAICSMESEWNSQPITLVLDHINGIRDDHRLENLRFLCPNCNSQQSTFAGRNNKKRRKCKKINYCINCGKVISKYGLRCYVCANKKYLNKPSKKQLLADIKKKPMLKVGLKYNVSDNAVRKWCKSYGLPFKLADIKKIKS